MNNWEQLSIDNFDKLVKTRQQLHQAVQLVGLVPRGLNPEDPGDKYGSLLWSDKYNGVLSQLFGENHRVALNLINLTYHIIAEDTIVDSLSLDGKTFEEALEWIATSLAKLEYDAEKLSAELPYEIPKYDTTDEALFEVGDTQINRELCLYFSNTNAFLEELVSSETRASAIRCWPHHFDIATLITLKHHDDPEEATTIGVGLSPGDEGNKEPYFYITPWPYPTLDHSDLPTLPIGHWQEQGWTGLLIKASDILAKTTGEEQKEATTKTLNTARTYFEKLLTK